MKDPLSLHRFSLARPIGSLEDRTDERRELWLAIAMIALYLVANIIYGFIAQAPWDDDCIVRYFNTVKAWHDPSQLFSVWNRPLFVLLFAPAALLGKSAMMLQMVLISAAAGWVLFLSARRMRAPHAWMVLPLFFFQNYFFSISRDNLTEPLAVALICFGLYALVTRRFLLFAFMGSLLPLARLELSVVLPLWALILLWEKRAKYIAVLALPTLLLMVAGYLFADKASLLWLVNDTVGADNDKNRYGHTDMWHYFQRIGFVVGPVVFLFLTTGLVERFARWRADAFVLFQGLLIFALYVLFSWKLNMGNAAGFLRNLIPLTPFIALIAMDGFNAWLSALQPPAAAVPEEDPTEQLPENGRRNKASHTAPTRARLAKAEEEFKAASRTRKRQLLRVSIVSLITLWLSNQYFSWELLSHHKISTKPTYTAELITAAIVLVLLIFALVSLRRRLPNWVTACFTGAVVITGVGSTLDSETPDSHLNPERKTITELSTLFREGRMQEAPLYVNHLWFFWPHDLGYPADRYRTLTKANVQAAPAHSRFFWESHYSNRLAGDVQLEDLVKRKDVVELCRAVSHDQSFTAVLFQKVDPRLNDGPALVDAFMKAYPNVPYAYCSRAMHESDAKQHELAIADVTTMLAQDTSYVYGELVAGMIYFNAAQYPTAIAHYQRVLQLDTSLTTAYHNIGLCKLRSGDAKGSIPYFKKALYKDQRMSAAQENIAVAYYQMQDYGNSLTAYSNTLRMNPRSGAAYIGRGNCYFQLKKFKEALGDYANSLKLLPGQGYVMKNEGLCLLQLGRQPEACAQFQQAVVHGDPSAAQMLGAYCK